jgi:hypothetical protein
MKRLDFAESSFRRGSDRVCEGPEQYATVAAVASDALLGAADRTEHAIFSNVQIFSFAE